jgi:hypothetical protein
VHAVEVADGHVRAGKGRRDVCEVGIKVHDARLLRGRCAAGRVLSPTGRAAASVRRGYVPQLGRTRKQFMTGAGAATPGRAGAQPAADNGFSSGCKRNT